MVDAKDISRLENKMPCICWFRHAGFIGGKPTGSARD